MPCPPLNVAAMLAIAVGAHREAIHGDGCLHHPPNVARIAVGAHRDTVASTRWLVKPVLSKRIQRGNE